MLDNESQSALKKKTTGIGFIFQLVPPRLILEDNIEERIQTLNDDFVLGICRSYTNYTLKILYHVLPQSKITLNML